MGDRERGAATIILVAVLGIALAVAGGAVAVTRVAVVRAQLSAAADLAALAAAAGDCPAARSVAAVNAATVLECARDGPDHRVTVAAELTVLPTRTVMLTATARAGPPEP